jgi:hypothetical protein
VGNGAIKRSLRKFLAVGLMAMLALVGGCVQPGPAPGHLVGHVHTQGGMKGTIRPAAATITASLVSETTKEVHTVDTASDGSFSVDLPPGTYTLTGMLIGSGSGDRTTPQDVQIVAGATTQAEVFAYYP